MGNKSFNTNLMTEYFSPLSTMVKRFPQSRLLAAGSFMVASLPLSSWAEEWVIDSQEEWKASEAAGESLEIKDGMATPSAKEATFQSVLKVYPEKKKASSLTVEQAPLWQNWESAGKLGPRNLGDAPVFVRRGPKDYWIFGRYGGFKKTKGGQQRRFVAMQAELEGFEIPLFTTPEANQFNASGGLEKGQGGYHAWQSRDMKNWVHHGAITDAEARWMTTAEHVDGKFYFYYDFPNDQDPHLIIDEDVTDGKLGKKMGRVIKDPSHGSDSAIIRDLEGGFHLIIENWDPINARTHGWDSPLASHAVSPDGISGFEIKEPAVDYRTKPTGKTGTYKHPHWTKEDPENFLTDVAEYEIHEPEQDAYGDWAAIAIGGQYYLFGDFDPVNRQEHQGMKVAWFTSSDIDKEPFKFCGSIGKGHPDPDVMFAEGQFYLVTQTKEDFISPGPWVDGVQVRVGVDTSNDGQVDQWTEWQEVKESYSGIEGFAKQVAKTPAQLDLSKLPEGFGFQFEVKLADTTENDSVPILDKVSLSFGD